MKLIFRLFILFLIASCKDYSKPVEINHPTAILTLPGYFQPEELAEDGSAEYANRYRNVYLVLIDKSKSEPLDSISIKGKKRIEVQMDSLFTTSEVDTINGIPIILNKINGLYPKEKERVYYYHYTIGGKLKNYELTMWTRGVERNQRYASEFEKIIESFKEKN